MEEVQRTCDRLPKAFVDRMRRLLGSDFQEFMDSYDTERVYGLRRNPLKGTEKKFLETMPFALHKISWAAEGFFYDPAEQPGKHVYHEAGAYYIQEPSAMAVVEILDPKPGELILDLCAAPGGKSTQIAGRMNGQGFLLSNEIVPGRAKILGQNVERMGIRNCVVSNETPEHLASLFPSFFDRIVVDAPCSGEGMFRKDEVAIKEWSPEHVQMCAQRQRDILEQAAMMLKTGGVLVYSTCTFSPEENEGVISAFLQKHQEFEIEKVPHDPAFISGKQEWLDNPCENLEDTMRLMPHLLSGEGHFIARLKKSGELFKTPEMSSGNEDKKLQRQVEEFLGEELGIERGWLTKQRGVLQHFGEQIYLVPGYCIDLKGVRIVRPGLHIGTEKKNRIEPSHALALALQPGETDRAREISLEEASRYMRGESLSCDAKERGWLLLVCEGYPIGFGKASNGQIKNHYPKGLRREL